MQLSFLIPCLNEVKTITKVVAQADRAGRKYFPGQYEVVVADNGSTDGTLEKLAKQNVARIVRVPIRGYGAALHWGIFKAKGRFVIYADADCSYNFQEVGRFKPLLQGHDLILGSRWKGEIKPGAMPLLHRYLGTPILTWLIRFLYAYPVSDCNSGMRLVRKKFYTSLHMHNSGMEWASELLIKTALNRGRYIEVPITLRPDQRQRPAHLLSWIDGWRHLKAIILLRPNFLFLIVVSLLLIAVIIPPLRIFFLCAALGLGLATLAAKLLQFAVDHTQSLSVQWLQKLPLVPCLLLLNIGVIIGLAVVQLKAEWQLFISMLVMLLDVWLFHIETIKTHVMYRLPEKLR